MQHDHLFRNSGLTDFKIYYDFGKKPENLIFIRDLYNQICFRFAKLYVFLRIICIVIQKHHTDAPWPFISKVGAEGLSSFAGNFSNNRKFDIYQGRCNQIYFGLAKLSIFLIIICTAIRYYHTDAAWPFISKFGADGFSKFATILVKKPKIWYLSGACVTKYVSDLQNYIYSFALYV